MASIYFFPKNKKLKRTSVQIRITKDGAVKKLGSGITIETAKWDSNKQRLSKKRALTLAEQKDNDFIESLDSAFYANEHLNLSEISNLLKSQIKGEETNQKPIITLIEGFDIAIGNTQYKKGTVKTYKVSKNVIKEFRPSILLDEVNLDFINELTLWLENKGQSESSIFKTIKHIKSVMQQTLDRGHHKNEDFKKFKVKNTTADNIALTADEVELLEKIDLTGQAELVRDYFLLGCYTGLRFSDFEKIKPHSIKDGILKVKTTKTGKPVAVPMKQKAISIIKKYGEMPKAPANQVFNRKIKSVAEKAGIEGSFLSTTKKGGKEIEIVIPRHKAVKTHTARRTFATMAYHAGVPSISIMKITGHKTEKNFLLYLKVSEEEHAKIMAKNPFFL